jgi:hypothetical protein
MNWLTIETAPKGTWLIGYNPELLGVCFVIWDEYDSGWYADASSQDGSGYYNVELTHWMPLPEPPK